MAQDLFIFNLLDKRMNQKLEKRELEPYPYKYSNFKASLNNYMIYNHILNCRNIVLGELSMIGLDQDHSSWIHNENKVNQQLSIFITSLANKAKILIDAKLVLCVVFNVHRGPEPRAGRGSNETN